MELWVGWYVDGEMNMKLESRRAVRDSQAQWREAYVALALALCSLCPSSLASSWKGKSRKFNLQVERLSLAIF